ncbi:hypothetical protein [Streptomyces sp. AcE210]|uniref:hypothetical protein n=1 Tax=Streptomyces sp. AcE210 TaxID=2292703 RepID=UPI000E30418C|nr:hypothetical protein [Streptomyces sp. AcE210]RFC77920.1 hypothetical protein DXZ75_08910 [Streptomyces sp. AcE210]
MDRGVETWLRREYKAPGTTAGQRLRQAFDSVRSVLPCDDALGMGGTLLFHLYEHPKALAPTRVSDFEQLIRPGEHTAAGASHTRGPAPTPRPAREQTD